MKKATGKRLVFLICIFSLLCFTFFIPGSTSAAEKATPGSMAEKFPKPNAFFDADKMGDMSDFDPAKWVSPTGDTIKIAAMNSYSGPGSINGQLHLAPILWAVHDINKRGGIWVDGKKKLIQVIKADHMAKPDQCKKAAERMVLQDKVHILIGSPGSNMVRIMNEVGNKYKVLVWNYAGMSDDLYDATNFTRYSFQGSYSTEQVSRGLAYYLGQIRKKEKRFYILNQDYSFGHASAEAFHRGLKEYYPEAQIVGEDFHKLFLTDFAPYLTKIKAVAADAIFTADWAPDSVNILKQSRQMGVNVPFVSNYLIGETAAMQEIGIDGTKGIIHIDQCDMPDLFAKPGYVKFHKAWLASWNKWSAPYNSIMYKHGSAGFMGSYCMQIYWLLSAIERAKSTDVEKIISVLENDVFQYANGKIVKMRACDHKIIQDFSVTEIVPPEQQKISYAIPPYYWFDDFSWAGQLHIVPAKAVLPWMDQQLERCKGKNGWGE